MPAVGELLLLVKLSSGSIRGALTKQTIVGGNQALPSSRGETVNCCGWEMHSACPHRSGLLHRSLLQRLALVHPAPSHSSANQQICNLSAVMNRGLL